VVERVTSDTTGFAGKSRTPEGCQIGTREPFQQAALRRLKTPVHIRKSLPAITRKSTTVTPVQKQAPRFLLSQETGRNSGDVLLSRNL
jgi:hypothetical protein